MNSNDNTVRVNDLKPGDQYMVRGEVKTVSHTLITGKYGNVWFVGGGQQFMNTSRRITLI